MFDPDMSWVKDFYIVSNLKFLRHAMGRFFDL